MCGLGESISDHQFEDYVLKAKGYALLYFWKKNASVCAFGARALEEKISEQGVPLTWFRLDVEGNPATAAKCGITALPSYILFKDGRVVAVKTGLLQGEGVRGWLEAAMCPQKTEGVAGSIRSALRFVPSLGG